MIEPLAQWAARPAVPNGLFLLAVLSSPARWSKAATKIAKQKLSSAE